MYQDKLVAAIKVNGQILRESGDTVLLPFGCEYSLLVKNLNSVRAEIAVSIDGKDAVGRIIVASNSSIELERFIRDGNLDAGNKFKFIERSDAIEQHRGITADDGIVRVEAWRERVHQFIDIPRPRYYDYPVPRPLPPRVPFYPMRPMRPARPTMHPTASSGSSPRPQRSASAGITVPGDRSQQKFYSTNGFPVERQSAVIVLNLRGYIGEIPVSAPVTVNDSYDCITCGKSNKSSEQYCSRCGTAVCLV